MIALIDDRHALDRHELERRLRQLAHWYRELAERTGNPGIWEARLKTAAELEREADRLDRMSKATAPSLRERHSQS
jgi:hypothetical protein